MLLLAGCDSRGQSSDGQATSAARHGGEYPIQVVCTTQQVADIVMNVGGEFVEIDTLMGAGGDPHTYKASAGDVRRFSTADLIFYNGMHLEGRLADQLVQFARRKPVFPVTAGLQEADDPRLREPEEFEGHYDPHLWHDASLWAECVDYVAEQLAGYDPEHAATYRENADQYIAQLKDLHDWAKQEIAQIPAEQRVLVTAHDAFGYFGAAYDIEVHGLQGISTVDEATLKTISETVEMLADRNIQAIFPETSVSSQGIASLVERARARDHEVHEGGLLYSDAMGEAGTPEATYEGMFRHNVNTVVEALRGEKDS